MCIVCMLGNYSIISKNPRKIRLNFGNFGKRKNNQHQKGKGWGGGGEERGCTGNCCMKPESFT